MDLTIGTDDIALNAVTVEKIAEGTNGQVITTNAAGDVVWGIAQAGASTTTLRIGGDGTTLNPLDLADDAVNSAKIEDNTISADDIDTGAVTTDETLDLTIGTDDIALNAVTVEKIAEGTNGQVITTNAAGDVVWGIAQAGASTTTLRIGGDGTTLNPLDLADDAVNSAKIEDNTISADDIDTGAVTTDGVRWT